MVSRNLLILPWNEKMALFKAKILYWQILFEQPFPNGWTLNLDVRLFFQADVHDLLSVTKHGYDDEINYMNIIS